MQDIDAVGHNGPGLNSRTSTELGNDYPENWDRMTEVERAEYIGVPPYPYSEEDMMDTSHPGHPSNYGDR